MVPILYEDNHLLVVVKPAGMLSQADRTGDPDLLTVAKAYIKEAYDKPGAVYLGLVHRLDRPASGVMVLARTSKAAQRLTRQFKNRHVTKQYLAWVEGVPPVRGLAVDYLRKRDQAVAVVDADAEGAKRAELRWERLLHTDQDALLRVHLQTGRPHQIRVQCATRGFPIVGDVRYGAQRRLDGRAIALHSAVLGLDHPTQRTRMTWQAPPPPWRSDIDRYIESTLA